MARLVLRTCLLLTVIHLTDGQSTSADPRCVYTFNVPPSDCGQAPGPSVDDQLLKSHVIALQAQVKQMANDMKVMREQNDKLASDVEKLKNDRPNSNTGTANQQSSTGGAVYTQWGRTTCPQNGTDLLYSGVVAGSLYTHSGGGSNYLCLHRVPEWGKTTAGFQSTNYLYGAEYEIQANDPFSKSNAQSLHDNNVPCAVCLVTSRPTKLMIPARLTCPDGWTKEYSGYLMAGSHRDQGRTTYVCMDNAPEVIEGGSANQNGVLFYSTESFCGSLPCPNFGDGLEITCVVCTK